MIQKKLPRMHGVPLVWLIYTGVCMQQVGKGVRLSMAVSPCYKFGHTSVFRLEGRTLGQIHYYGFLELGPGLTRQGINIPIGGTVPISIYLFIEGNFINNLGGR